MPDDAPLRPEPVLASKNVLVVFQTHVFGWQVRRAFLAISRSLPSHFEAIVLAHLPPGAPVPPLLETVPHMVVRTPEIRNPAYAGKSGLNQPNWAIWNGGHTDLPLLRLAEARPGYAHYWGIEYDVRYTGSWRTFFSRYDDSDADFLGANIRDAVHDPKWHWWDTLVVPDGVPPPTGPALLCSFMPVYRVSSRLVHALDRAYRTGWSGHSEVTWPTLARRFGMTVADLGGQGAHVRLQDRGHVYTNNTNDWLLSPGTYVFKPLKHVCWRRNMLWHPVKPLSATLQEDYGLLRKNLDRATRKIARVFAGGALGQPEQGAFSSRDNPTA